MSFEINHIKYIQAIVENDFNITAAAHKIHISQPALSKSINLIESEYHVHIFTRDKNY
ncbi:helix-turn-helix domain-containing protein [Ligilactobacillus salivarius]|uniref:helix-turn-helix domain-containing protein n=1 Tax=Ligilactobacillus salivarius TaxID=1624 RepID=UPI0039912F44